MYVFLKLNTKSVNNLKTKKNCIFLKDVLNAKKLIFKKFNFSIQGHFYWKHWMTIKFIKFKKNDIFRNLQINWEYEIKREKDVKIWNSTKTCRYLIPVKGIFSCKNVLLFRTNNFCVLCSLYIRFLWFWP